MRREQIKNLFHKFPECFVKRGILEQIKENYRYDKNTFRLPRQEMNSDARMQDIRAFYVRDGWYYN
ncbi:hypothetical protein D3Z45_19825 [Lachnospiraceae bacterium]|nr:hypothetical protein [Lachnospiraceae bacterium]